MRAAREGSSSCGPWTFRETRHGITDQPQGVPGASQHTHINMQCKKFAIKYGYTSCTELSALRRVDFLLKDDDAMTTLTTLTWAVKARGEQLYLFIDEYDRFANHFLLEREEFDTWGYRAAGRRGLAHQADLHDAQESPGAGPLAPVHHRPFAAGLQRQHMLQLGATDKR